MNSIAALSLSLAVTFGGWSQVSFTCGTVDEILTDRHYRMSFYGDGEFRSDHLDLFHLSKWSIFQPNCSRECDAEVNIYDAKGNPAIVMRIDKGRKQLRQRANRGIVCI